MGLMDKVKAQAAQLAQMTQEAALEGRAKLDQAQSGRRGDVLLRSLGAAVFAERTGRGTADSQAKIEQLIADISAYERDNALNLADSQPVVPQPSFPADPPSSFPGPAASSFPAAGNPYFPGAGDTAPAQMPTFFQSPEEPAGPGAGAFPPEG
jgi:hypothetical protein